MTTNHKGGAICRGCGQPASHGHVCRGPLAQTHPAPARQLCASCTQHAWAYDRDGNCRPCQVKREACSNCRGPGTHVGGWCPFCQTRVPELPPAKPAVTHASCTSCQALTQLGELSAGLCLFCRTLAEPRGTAARSFFEALTEARVAVMEAGFPAVWRDRIGLAIAKVALAYQDATEARR